MGHKEAEIRLTVDGRGSGVTLEGFGDFVRNAAVMPSQTSPMAQEFSRIPAVPFNRRILDRHPSPHTVFAAADTGGRNPKDATARGPNGAFATGLTRAACITCFRSEPY